MMLRRMDGSSIAHELPELYRSLLDRVALLERAGSRREAALLRRDATSAYSHRWDERARRRLVALVTRADRVLAGSDRARTVSSQPWLVLFRRWAA